MKAQDVIRSVMKQSNVTQQELANRLNKSGPSTISMLLRNSNMRIDVMTKILDICGYDLVARSRDGVRQDYVIDDGETRIESLMSSDAKLRQVIRSMVDAELKRRGVGDGGSFDMKFTDDELYNDTEE